jgi:hypothetical protein
MKNERVSYKDYPFEQVCASVDELAAEGHRCYQKFTCGKCGERLGMDRPNVMYTSGSCDKCGYVTNIKERGCNYMLISFTKREAKPS